MSLFFFRALMIGGVLSLTACASAPSEQQAATANNTQPAYVDVRDPLERINRPLWDFNYDVLDAYLLRPLTVGYITVVPKPARKGLSNVVNNLGEPASFVNSVLQAKPKKAAVSVGRFVLNSTTGFFGLFDVATNIGLTNAEEDFSQTMAVWGIGDGPFLMIPARGPTTVRDTAGSLVDNLYFPLSLLNTPLTISRAVIGALDGREQLMQVENMLNDSLDPYSFVKESYYQRQIFKIYDGNPPQPEETLDDDMLDFLEEIE
ncbi:VacJ family lipoprotein [Alishewanella sp. SMS8]|uniref:MlaA family lipoprotein n=1 Tax=unclassified Alishewanella TaxID=2628974 RepID=UPI00274262F8|nr:VacJ family lipoprotein [Alishewanella sp. SMS8]MDP4945356.1 VacJ family lipoprotein [Alishewanella sp.]MDP5207505.1 VacJ family lipoprotein [Alishewanella sp. SMS9]MDP5036922.1 VacJ family lipoprotein [Alishewanella sp.]MDP5186551.1 VacJ family lipoprotein [Alishewanella sp.]MDP5460116.1 VacJ family lipoprotein [Alishewanella sp. SMS8]